MSRFYFSLAVLLLLLACSSSRAETILADNNDNSVTLPSTGGSARYAIANTNPTRSISPYILSIGVNNGAANSPMGQTAGEQEMFWLSAPAMNAQGVMGYGGATIVSEMYSSVFNASIATPAAICAANHSSPNAVTGLYTLTFHIPAGQWLLLNVTYKQTKLNPLNITEFITLAMYEPANLAVAITGDPQFVGLRGQQYQVHGIDGAVYNIISEEHTQVNSRFVFLTEGECPVIGGMRDTNCWSHPGSYLGEMSFQAVVDGKLHAALVQAGPAFTGFAGVQVDGQALSVGESVELGDFTLAYTSSHDVSVTTRSFDFALHNSDAFINQQLKARVPLSQLSAHGLLGQTHSAKTYANALKHVEGDVDDYVVQDGNIFGSDFLFNQFQQ